MYIIYNKDGSIKKKNFAEFIQKGNNNANFIFVGIDGLDLTDYSCYATFELPNGELGGPVAGVPIVEFSDELPYSGYNIPVTAEMTQYEGQLKLSLHIENSQGAVMYTYPVILVINDATAAPDETKISLSQYQALLNAINSKPVPTSNLFFTVVDDISAIPETEMAQYSIGKIFYDKATQMFYQKTKYGISNYRLFIPDYLQVDLNETWTTLKYGLWQCYLIKRVNNIIHFEDVTTNIRNGDYDNKHLTNSKLKTFDKEIDLARSYSDYYFVLRKGRGAGTITYLIPEFVFADLCYYKQIILYDKDSYYPSRIYDYNYKLIRLDSLEDIIELTDDTSVDSGTLTNEQAERIFANDNILLKHSGYIFRKVHEGNPATFICIKDQHTESSSSVIVTHIEKIIVTGVYDAYSWSRSSVYSRVYVESKVNELLGAKQNTLTFDTTPTADSDNPVTSDGIKNYVDTVVTGAVEFKGTVADLTELNAIQNPSSGNMYWVTSESCYYIYNGTQWSAAGGNVDLSNYYTKAESDNKYVTLEGGTSTSPEWISGVKRFNDKVRFGNTTIGETSKYFQFGSIGGGRYSGVLHDNSDSYVFEIYPGFLLLYTNLYPDATSSNRNLGSSSRKWTNLWLSGDANVDGSLNVASWTFAQGLNVSDQPDGSFNIKDSNGNLVLKFLQQGVGEGTISYNRISPNGDALLDLGSYGNTWGNHRWKDIYLSNGVKIFNSTNGAYFTLETGLNSLDFKFGESSASETLLKFYAETRTGQTTLYHAIVDFDDIKPNYDNFTSLGASDKKYANVWAVNLNGTPVADILAALNSDTSITITSGSSGTLAQEEVDVLVNAGSQAKIYYGSGTQKVYDLASDQEISASEHVLTFIKEDDVSYSAPMQRYEINYSIISVSTLNGAWSKTDTTVPLNGGGSSISYVDISSASTLYAPISGSLTQQNYDALVGDDSILIRLTDSSSNKYIFKKVEKINSSGNLYYECEVDNIHYSLKIDASLLTWEIKPYIPNYEYVLYQAYLDLNDQITINDELVRYELENNPSMLIGFVGGSNSKTYFRRTSGNDSELYRTFSAYSYGANKMWLMTLQYNKSTHTITYTTTTYNFVS